MDERWPAKLIAKVSGLYHKATGGDRLVSYEKLCFDAWRESLSANAKEILGHQCRNLELIQRQAGGAKVCMYYDEKAGGSQWLFENKDPNLHVADVYLSDSGTSGRPMKVKVYLHRGRLFSFEFPKRPSRYMELNGLREENLYVSEVRNLVAL